MSRRRAGSQRSPIIYKLHVTPAHAFCLPLLTHISFSLKDVSGDALRDRLSICGGIITCFTPCNVLQLLYAHAVCTDTQPSGWWYCCCGRAQGVPTRFTMAEARKLLSPR